MTLKLSHPTVGYQWCIQKIKRYWWWRHYSLSVNNNFIPSDQRFAKFHRTLIRRTVIRFSVLSSLALFCLSWVWKSMSEWLTEWLNYKVETRDAIASKNQTHYIEKKDKSTISEGSTLYTKELTEKYKSRGWGRF